MTQYCPNCIEILTKDRRKLGRSSVWMVCPICGYRERPISIYQIGKELTDFEEMKKRINSNINQFNNDRTYKE